MSSVASVANAVSSHRSLSTRGPSAADDAAAQGPFAMLLDAASTEPSPAPPARGTTAAPAPQPHHNAEPCGSDDTACQAPPLANNPPAAKQEAIANGSPDANAAEGKTADECAHTTDGESVKSDQDTADGTATSDGLTLPVAGLALAPTEAPPQKDRPANDCKAATPAALAALSGTIADDEALQTDSTAKTVPASNEEPTDAVAAPSSEIQLKAAAGADSAKQGTSADHSQSTTAIAEAQQNEKSAPTAQPDFAGANAPPTLTSSTLPLPKKAADKVAPPLGDSKMPPVPDSTQSNGAPANLGVTNAVSAANAGQQPPTKSTGAKPQTESDDPHHLTIARTATDEVTPAPTTRSTAMLSATTAGTDLASTAFAQTASAPVSPALAGAAPTPTTLPATAIPLSALPIEIAAQAKDGKNRFEIRLDPPELGRIDVRLDIDKQGNVASRLVVDRPETLDLLRRDASQLERALQNAGLKTSDQGMQFSLRDQGFAGRSDGAQIPAGFVTAEDDTAVPAFSRQGYGQRAGLGGGIDIQV